MAVTWPVLMIAVVTSLLVICLVNRRPRLSLIDFDWTSRGQRTPPTTAFTTTRAIKPACGRRQGDERNMSDDPSEPVG